MDGALSLVAAWMPRRGDPAFSVRFTACPKGSIVGVHFFGDFLCASKESYSPVSITLCTAYQTQNGRNDATERSSCGLFCPSDRARVRPVVLFRPSQGDHFAQAIFGTGDPLSLLVQRKGGKKYALMGSAYGQAVNAALPARPSRRGFLPQRDSTGHPWPVDPASSTAFTATPHGEMKPKSTPHHPWRSYPTSTGQFTTASTKGAEK